MKDFEILVDGEIAIIGAAENVHEASKKIKMHKENLRKCESLSKSEITVLIDGVELKHGPRVDVRLIARNMKTQYLENKLLNCHEI